MKYDIYQIDTFTNEIFRGNPACVVPLNKWLEDDILLKIAKENAVAETAYFIKNKFEVQLRWFTPEIEIDLCGHATLAVAHVLRSIFKYSLQDIVFNTLSGKLTVKFDNDFYYLNFPSRNPEPATLPRNIEMSLNIQPQEVLKSRDYLLVYKNEEEIKNIKINKQIFDQFSLGCGGVIVTSTGNSVDFVSRYFTPQASILEDPVTGSAHCSLIPFWSSRLSKNNLNAVQISDRGGVILCEDRLERVVIGGQAKTFLKGQFSL